MTIPQLYEIFKTCSGVSTDTRSIQPGNLYFALKGENFDGNKFAGQALENGARYAVIDDPDYGGSNTLVVKDVLQSLQQLSQYHRQQLSAPVIGLTGSNGKTTTKELMASVLSMKYKTAFTKGNLNNHIGVPLTLLSIGNEHEMAIVEMGANHQKEIEFLCSLCRPDYGYITNFGKAHLEGFGGEEGVVKGKSELFGFLREVEGHAFVNADDPKQIIQSEGLEKITFGESPEARYKISLDEDHPGETLRVKFNGLSITTHLTGQYNFSNVGAAIAAGQYFKVPDTDIKTGLENYRPQNNRSQITITAKNKLVVDTYNANPSSTEAALHNFAIFPATEKWVILGDMFELGEFSAIEHQRIAEQALAQGYEKIVLVGMAYSQCSLESPNALQLKTTEELLQFLEDEKPEGKTILLKGSRGMKLEKALALL